MKKLTFLFLIGCFISCSSIKESTEGSMPKLLLQYPLPSIPTSINNPSAALDAMLYILEDGSVSEVRLTKGSEDTSWNNSTMAAIKQWQFVPAYSNNKPVRVWYHLHTVIHFAEPINYQLAQIVCDSMQKADSAFHALEQGTPFENLAQQYSIDASRSQGGTLGVINIYSYPEEIRSRLAGLNADEYTKPIAYGNRYFIFKRLK